MAVDPADIERLGLKVDAWMGLEAALREDVLGVLDLLDAQPDNQAVRRALVRSLWGFVEGSVYGMRSFLRTAHILSSTGGEEELPDRERTIDRVKKVLKMAAKDMARWEADFGTEGWEALRANLKVRDRLMHPKSASDVQISDGEVDEARDAATWLLETIVQIQSRAAARGERRPARGDTTALRRATRR